MASRWILTRCPGVPTLYVKNETAANVSTEMIPVPVSRFSAYYKHIEHAEVPIPQNYRVASGNAFGKTAADVDPLNGIQWFCEYGVDNEEDKDDAAFPARCSSSRLQQIILLPDCVNEDTLESAFSGVQNWNATYKAANRCPEGMKRMPQLRYSIRYNLESIYPDGWAEEIPLQLACGNSFCSHGDFINGWDPEAAENMAAAKQKPFIGVDGPFGKYNDGSVCKTKAKDADPEHGTGDYYTSLLSM